MEYFQPLRGRIPFPLMQRFCVQKGLPTAQGWDKLKVKIDEEISTGIGRENDVAEKLEEIFRETLTIGNRAMRFFRLEADDSSRIGAILSAAEPPPTSDFQGNYPKPLDVQELSALSNDLVLCEVIRESATATTLIFCGKRFVEERVPRNSADMDQNLLNSFGWGGYDEVVLIKRRYVQSYEVIRCDTATGIVELRVEDHKGIDAATSLQQLQHKLNALLAPALNYDAQLIHPINLFPAINGIYSAQEGKVVELGFFTDSGSAKHEKMRASGLDLRLEPFHAAGKLGVNGVLNPFRLGVRWQDQQNKPYGEIILPGSIRQLSNATPYLEHAVFLSVASEAHMTSLITKLVGYIP